MATDEETVANEEPPVTPNFSVETQGQLLSLGLEIGQNGYVIWRKDNPSHPRNWTALRKGFDIGLIVIFDLVATIISTAGTAASEDARSEFGIGQTLSLFYFTSVYLIGQAVGGVLFPPYSEAFGRKNLYVVSTFLFSLFCVLIGAVPSIAAIVIGRFATGLLSAIPSIILAGSIEDMFNSGPRIWMVYVWSMAANLGFCIGPIVGAYVTAEINWQWNFYLIAIITGVLGFAMLAMRESRPSLLLNRRLKILQRLTGDPSFHIQNPDHNPDIRTYVNVTLARPLRLLLTEPIVFAVAVMCAVAFALIYLFVEAAPIVYGAFGLDARYSSLSFIAVGIGLFLGVPIRFYDQRVFKRRRLQRRTLEPEDKLTGFAIAAPALAICLWWFAWTIPPLVPHVHWSVSMLSLILLGYATNEFDAVLAGYLADSYTIYAASAFAAMCFLRASFSAAFPLFARQLFVNLGANVAASILAAIATVFCFFPILFVFRGERLRRASKFAKYSLNAYSQNRVDADEWESHVPQSAPPVVDGTKYGPS
ncbi:hypothetical protein JMJ35_006854 [Cladonia borealis]|uniref:Major facilitator superfamily (MFS) profile domain-containing protein n=1 Tax=Cladonia borealis TaxID=184061 RepID=A0AA39QWA2_9LECA|nr:hypothetical protein JMJ35_006854 [Cladonia borealis]